MVVKKEEEEEEDGTVRTVQYVQTNNAYFLLDYSFIDDTISYLLILLLIVHEIKVHCFKSLPWDGNRSFVDRARQFCE